MSNVITLGLIQMACSDDVSDNFQRSLQAIKDAAKKGANIICTQELFKSLYFCQVEDSKNFELAEEINENNQTIREFSTLASKLDIVLIASLFEKRAAGFTTTLLWCSMLMGAYWANTARCTSRMTLIIMKNSTSPRVIWDIRSFNTKYGRNWGVDLLGPMVS